MFEGVTMATGTAVLYCLSGSSLWKSEVSHWRAERSYERENNWHGGVKFPPVQCQLFKIWMVLFWFVGFCWGCAAYYSDLLEHTEKVNTPLVRLCQLKKLWSRFWESWLLVAKAADLYTKGCTNLKLTSQFWAAYKNLETVLSIWIIWWRAKHNGICNNILKKV